MAEQHEKALVPQIRFTGFTDPWEQRKLSDLVLIERGGSPRPIDAYITEDPAGLNWVKIGDAPSMGRYITSTSEKIKPEGLSKTRQVYPGDLVLSNSMSFGRPYIMAIEGCIHDGWLLIRDTQNQFDPVFLCHMLGTPKMLDQYRMFASGSTVNNLNKDLVGNATVPVPNRNEQVEIGKYLDELDSLITLHQRKYDKLCVLKKSMLDKMFPKGGSLYPEIRFAGFTDPWEQRKLGEVARRVTRKNENGDSDLPLTISAQYGLVDQRTFFNSQVASKDMSGYFLLHRGEFAYNKSTSTDSPWGAIKRLEKYDMGCVSTLYICFELLSEDPDFLVTYYETDRWYKAVQLIAAEGARNHGLLNIAPDDFFETQICIPKRIDEQRQIGAFFDRLDSLITLHQRKLKLLRNIKKSMLDKMFV